MKRAVKARPILILIGLIVGIMAVIFSFPLQFCDDYGDLQKVAGCMQIAGACLLTYTMPKLLPDDLSRKALLAMSLVGLALFGLFIGMIISSECAISKWAMEILAGIALPFLFPVAERWDGKPDRTTEGEANIETEGEPEQEKDEAAKIEIAVKIDTDKKHKKHKKNKEKEG